MKIIPIVLLGLLILPESIFQVSIFPLSVVDAHPIKTRPVKPLLQIFHHLPGHPIHPGHQSPSHPDHQSPSHPDHQSPSQSHTVVGGRNPLRTPLECDACEYLANGLNQTVLHNPKVISIVTTEIEQICQVLPSSVQQLCLNAAEQTAPVLLNHLGDFIATEGCIDLGVCHTAA
ncbi:MAG: hypothetical protein EBU66_18590 [Bacteroidetes bacterium]|nr:hypothetical protein [Bacteroidota bacterium]